MVPRRTAAVSAWGVTASACIAWGVAIWLGLNRPPHSPPLRFSDAVWGLSFLAFPVVGAIVASKKPRNVVGWLFCLGPLAVGASVAAFEYVHVPTRPGVTAAGIGANVGFILGAAMLGVFSMLYFPDGRLPSPRWHWFARVEVALVGVMIASWLFGSPHVDEYAMVVNPLHSRVVAPLAEAAGVVAGAGLVLGGCIGALSLGLRYRRGDGLVRRQLRVLLYVVGGVLALVVLDLLLSATGRDAGAYGQVLEFGTFVFAVVGAPSAVAVAILRYHLYDIDRLVRRTVGYALLTAVLVGAYAISVLLLQPVLQPLTGGSDLAVAASTLGVAAAFGPVRRRVQGAVDRRFDRARYDAARTVESFSQHLRDELDLSSLAAELRTVTASAMAPVHLSVWLRDPVTVPERSTGNIVATTEG